MNKKNEKLSKGERNNFRMSRGKRWYEHLI